MKVNGLSHAIAFCLLLGIVSLLNVTYAIEDSNTSSAPIIEKSLSIEITFAKYSEIVGNTKKTANCLKVSATDTSKEKNTFYCKYLHLGTELCDPEDGINMSEIKLSDCATFQNDLTKWFQDNTGQSFPSDKVQLVEDFMSIEVIGFPANKTLLDKHPKTIILTTLGSLPPPEKYATAPQKEFAWQIHKSIGRLKSVGTKPDKLWAPVHSTKPATGSNETVSQEYVTSLSNLLDELKQSLVADYLKRELELAEKINNTNIALLGLSIFLLVFVLAGLFLSWQHNKLLTQLSKGSVLQTNLDNINEKLENMRSESAKFCDLESDITKIMGGLEDIKQLIISNQRQLGTEPTSLPGDIKAQLSQKIQRLEPEKTRLEQSWEIEQRGIWRWAKLALAGELFACKTHFKQIKESGIDKNHKESGIDKNHKILELLELDNILERLDHLVGKIFESDFELWQFLRGIDSGKWLNQLLRADDLLQAYFFNESQFHLLSQHLSNVSGILQTVFLEKGVKLIKPKLLEPVPNYILEKHYVYKPQHILKELVKPQVQERLKKVSRFVVDIETYGFVTTDNSSADVRVFVSSLVEWE